MNLQLTVLSMLGTAILTSVILVLSFRRLLPNILEDVAVSAGEQISNKLNEVIGSPQVKQAMSIMGKKSGEVRANKALRNKAANKLLEGVPSIGFILDQLNLTPIEGLQLMQDPLVGPFIRGALSKGMGGLSGIMKGTGLGSASKSSTSDKNVFTVT